MSAVSDNRVCEDKSGAYYEPGQAHDWRENFFRAFFDVYPAAWAELKNLSERFTFGQSGLDSSARQSEELWEALEAYAANYGLPFERWVELDLQDIVDTLSSDPSLYDDGYQNTGKFGAVFSGDAFRFEVAAPRLTNESWEAFRRRAVRDFEAALSSYESAMDQKANKLGFKRVGKYGKSHDHFIWTVRKACERLTFKALAKQVGASESTVKDAVREVSEAIGMNIPSAPRATKRPNQNFLGRAKRRNSKPS